MIIQVKRQISVYTSFIKLNVCDFEARSAEFK